MKLKPIPLKKSVLKKNFEYWKKPMIVDPDPQILDMLEIKLFTTHSFPFEKETPNGDVIPYESIFSSSPQNGLLSNGYRKAVSINPDNDKSSRNIPSGLENYVFSYLGIHQPYYAKKKEGEIDIYRKPFGVFIANSATSSTVERFPDNHASRRDISKYNEDVDQDHTELEYLLPENARTLMAFQVCNDPEHRTGRSEQLEQFWHYYGNTKHWKDNDYATNSWKKKAEFRFFEKVAVADIQAVLWPIWVDGLDEDGNAIFSKTYEDLQTYSKEFRNVRFITYNLDLRTPELSFIKASYAAIAYYLQTGRFPDSVTIAESELNLN